MPVHIDVIDSSRRDTGFLVHERRFHPRALSCHDVTSFVHGVLLRAADDTIARLRIFGHGHEGQQAVGGGTRFNAGQVIGIDDGGSLMNREMLSMLCRRFAPGAIVQLYGCRVAVRYGELMIWELACLWQVRVQASLTRHTADPHDRFAAGQYREANGDLSYWRNSSPFAGNGSRTR